MDGINVDYKVVVVLADIKLRRTSILLLMMQAIKTDQLSGH